MITLNLTAKNTEQEVVKQYLEENASEMLAEKINNGVAIEEITDDMFCEYVGDFMSVEENTYTFTRKNGKGKNKVDYKYYLEG